MSDGWKPHDGGNNPVFPDCWVRTRDRGGISERLVEPAEDVNWSRVSEYCVFAPVTPGPSDFVRQTAARIMAALIHSDGFWDQEKSAKVSVDAAIALEKALKGVGK